MAQPDEATQPRIDGRARRGNETRRVVLAHAMDLASRQGLEALSLGRLATELSLSKSGIFALFGSKEDLQLATIRAADRVFVDQVVRPALTVPAGLDRVWRLCEAWISYSANRVFSGGCFFQTVLSESNSRPGPVREAIVTVHEQWRDYVAQTLTEAQHLGEVPPTENIELLTFEIIAWLTAANTQSLVLNDPHPYTLARAALQQRLMIGESAPTTQSALGEG